MTAHLLVDFLLGGAVCWLLFKCWRQQVEIHHLRSRLMLTRPMTMAELQVLTNEEMRALVERVVDVAVPSSHVWVDTQGAPITDPKLVARLGAEAMEAARSALEKTKP